MRRGTLNKVWGWRQWVFLLASAAFATGCNELVVSNTPVSNVQSWAWGVTCRHTSGGESVLGCRMDVGEVDTLELTLAINDTSLTGLQLNFLTDSTALRVRTMDVVLATQNNLAAGLGDGDTLTRADSLALRQRWEVVALRRGVHSILIRYEGQAISEPGVFAQTVDVTVGERWGTVTAGRDHTCALTYDDPLPGYLSIFGTGIRKGGEAFCWGDGVYGGLGSGSFNEPVPTELASDDRYLTLAAGLTHTCATAARGRLFCWGRNERGQLGTGDDLDQFFPTALALGIPFAQAALGDDFSCGVPVSLSGEVIVSATCWGSNAEGQLGCDDGDPNGGCFLVSLDKPGDQLTPAEDVRTAGGGAIFFTSIVAGARHACGIQVGSHTAWCWGDNSAGQLGVDNAVANCRKLGATPADTIDFPCSRVAVEVQGPGASQPLSFGALAAGDDFTCGVTADVLIGSTTEIYCWGRNDVGQLGDGTRSDSDSPVRIAAIDAPDGFFEITAGGAHACTLALADSVPPGVIDDLADAYPRLEGPAFCWGSNSDGQLGDGATTDRPQPVPVSGGLSFSTLAAGTAHTCGVVSQRVAVPLEAADSLGNPTVMDASIAFGGPIYCWGDNQAAEGGLGGKLGNGSTEDSAAPGRVSEPGS